jgi:hypothetical protein
MPAKISTDASITIRFGREILSILPRETVAKILDEFSDKYCIGLEQKGDESTQHWQIAAILRNPTDISDGFERKLKNRVQDVLEFEMTPEQKKYAIKAKSHHEIKGHFGYCSKQDTSPLTKGCDPGWMLEAQELYAKRLDQSEKKIPVSRSRFLPLIREMFDELWKQIGCDSEKIQKWNLMDDCKRFSILEKMLIIRGYDCSCVVPTQRQLIIRNFHEYVVGYSESSLDDMDVFNSE